MNITRLTQSIKHVVINCMRFRKSLFVVFLVASFFIFLPSFAEAQIDIPVIAPSGSGLKVITNAGSLISAGVALLLIISALAAFLYLVIGGIRWITSGGDKAGIDAARNQIQAALLGLFIVFAAWAIMLIVQQFFGVQILGGLSIPTPWQFNATTP